VSAPAGTATPQPANTRFLRWHRRILGVCLVIFAFELGLVLMIFPWLGNWDLNWLPLHSRLLSSVWLNPYFRGALSGLGLLNIYVSVSEAGRQIALVFPPKAE
jgi:hypothetical protein